MPGTTLALLIADSILLSHRTQVVAVLKAVPIVFQVRKSQLISRPNSVQVQKQWFQNTIKARRRLTCTTTPLVAACLPNDLPAISQKRRSRRMKMGTILVTELLTRLKKAKKTLMLLSRNIQTVKKRRRNRIQKKQINCLNKTRQMLLQETRKGWKRNLYHHRSLRNLKTLMNQ